MSGLRKELLAELKTVREECNAQSKRLAKIIGELTEAERPVKVGWMENRQSEVAQYHCTGCEEIFQFASDKHGTERPPIACPMCGQPTK